MIIKEKKKKKRILLNFKKQSPINNFLNIIVFDVENTLKGICALWCAT